MVVHLRILVLESQLDRTHIEELRRLLITLIDLFFVVQLAVDAFAVPLDMTNDQHNDFVYNSHNLFHFGSCCRVDVVARIEYILVDLNSSL